jgi:serine protease inhibitor
MTTQTDRFGYAQAKRFQLLEMPYAGRQFGLVILLPNVEGATSPSSNKE